MKRRFTFGSLMHNRNAMIAVSLVISMFIWGAVIFGGSDDEERILRIAVPVDLTGTYAEQLGLCVVGENTFDIQVRVKGKLSVISQLTAEDLRVRADTTSVHSTGKQTLTITASRNSAETDYSITSCWPNTVSVTFDYWDTDLRFKVGVDVSGVKVADESQHRLGDAVPDTSLLPDGDVIVEGPRSVTSRIDHIVARVTEPTAISETRVFSAELVALDAQNNEIDISTCKFSNLESTTVSVTVPVWVSREVKFTCDILNLPTGLASKKDLVTVSPSSVVVVGPQADVEAFVQSVQKVATVDFDKLSVDKLTQIVRLNVPSSVQVLDNTNEVTVKVNVKDYISKNFTINIGSVDGNVRLTGLPANMKAEVPTQSVTFTVVGPKQMVNRLTAKSFIGEIALSDTHTAGMNRYLLRIKPNNANTAWVYYGEATAGISVYVTLS